jgi:hypothetical protein
MLGGVGGAIGSVLRLVASMLAAKWFGAEFPHNAPCRRGIGPSPVHLA